MHWSGYFQAVNGLPIRAMLATSIAATQHGVHSRDTQIGKLGDDFEKQISVPFNLSSRYSD
jgi:hypothetical protein